MPHPLPPAPAGSAELKAHLQQRRAAPYWARLADFHLLLYLARQPNFDEPEVRTGGAVRMCVRNERCLYAHGFRSHLLLCVVQPAKLALALQDRTARKLRRPLPARVTLVRCAAGAPCPCTQVSVLVDAVHTKQAVPEGFQIIIDSMAGL